MDEALVAATAGELSPIVTGIVYCNTIAFCRDATSCATPASGPSADRWCERQPRDGCAQRALPGPSRRDHAAASVSGRGAAGGEAGRRAVHGGGCSISSPAARPSTARARSIVCGEVRRGRGGVPAASRGGASRSPAWRCCGWPGKGGRGSRRDPPRRSARTTQPLVRAELLPAYVEIMLAGRRARAGPNGMRRVEEIADARRASAARDGGTGSRAAVASTSRAAPSRVGACVAALALWPSSPRRTRRRAHACLDRAVPAARSGTRSRRAWSSRRLGCSQLERRPMARVDVTPDSALSAPDHGLTAREVEVLRLVAAGKEQP